MARVDSRRSRPVLRRWFWSLVTCMPLAGCTTVGFHTSQRQDVDFGPSLTLRICVLKTDDVPDQRVADMLERVRVELATYAIDLEVPWVRPWERPGFQMDAILDDIVGRPLEPPCDRLVGLVDRHVGDFLWGLAMPEVLGAVDDVTRTRGYFVATFGSINQALLPPGSVAVHEFYHLLGCEHDATLSNCYPRIAALKAAADPAADFFPGVDHSKQFLTTRAAVDAAFKAYEAKLEQASNRGCAKPRSGRHALECASQQTQGDAASKTAPSR